MRICLTILASLLAVIGSGQDAQSRSLSECGYFRFSPRATEAQLENSEASLLLIQLNGEAKGTGFLIESTRGYVLSARHVVEAALGKSDIVISGKSTIYQDQSIPLRIVREDQKLDVVILQIEQPENYGHLRTLELSFDMPQRYGEVTLFGYQFGDPNPTPATGQLSGPMGGKFLMRVNTFGGDSGSPIFDRYGLVVGIATDRRTRNASVIIPIKDAIEMILTVEDSHRAKSVAEKILLSRINDYRVFAPAFTPGQPNAINNVELLWVMKRLGEQADELTQIARQLVHCPVYIAAVHRGIGEAAIPLITGFYKKKEQLPHRR